ncbi:protein of unknown function (DUF1083) [Solitalea canadensis DSM 3403]|uniref:Uncharacterized protein n=1 Tax=Solitalea canadensis (strain ATCC 29591 / DSM 3403 / JCM 21819 / LMG 8368 / NBRC 15130 / NCIMB 12057 / USAM 9D) TaxID=929556 RepID=H8KQ79_SOLCM|nr:protein of unknown function (DUF1083) [Solitalea canadensis DSM 3403]
MPQGFMTFYSHLSGVNSFVLAFRSLNIASFLFCKLYVCLFLIIGLTSRVYSQKTLSPGDIPKKTLQALRVEKAPRIDGVLDEEIWLRAIPATDFIQTQPTENTKASFATEVRIAYDNTAIYIAALMHDPSPDSILHEFTKRDENGNADEVYFSFDTYFNQQNAVTFGVSAAGIQIDERIGTSSATNNNNNTGRVFDVVWDSYVKINDKGWVAELRIPYSALRFPKSKDQKWGLEIQRNIRRTREQDLWQYIPQNTQNSIPYYGILEGITDVEPPLRLSFTPYLGTTFSHFPLNTAGKNNLSKSYNAGMDFKLGLNENFTLDATLAPDFGQVASDNRILNLSAFETEFAEQRPFFKEGMELFTLGGLFYPRRIGAQPRKFYEVDDMEDNEGVRIIENPAQSQMLNATKISGRTQKGLGIGLFNAITNSMYAVVEDNKGNRKEIRTEPLTNYNIIAIDQTLPHNSSVSFINTNVNRFDVRDDANVTGLGFKLGTKSNKYQIDGFGAYSHKTLPDDSISNGYRYAVNVAKISGNFKFRLTQLVESDKYNPNDLGLLFSANEFTHSFFTSYEQFKPKNKNVQNWGLYSFNQYSNTYKTKEFQYFLTNLEYDILFKSRFFSFFFVEYKSDFNDFYEARTPGRVYKGPGYIGGIVGISTDYRKRLAADARIAYFDTHEFDMPYYEFKLFPRFRFNDHLSVFYEFIYSDDYSRGYAGKSDDEQSIYFGDRKIYTYTNALTGQYVFNQNMSLNLKARHYWSTVNYLKFFDLTNDGYITPNQSGYSTDNQNVNFFNIDMVYTWRFAPGSDVVLVYKQAIEKNDAIQSTSFFRNFGNVMRADKLNTVSLKVLYFLDYQSLKKKHKVKA